MRRLIISSASLVVLLGCANTVEVAPGALGSGGGNAYGPDPAAALTPADGPHMRLVSGHYEYLAYFTVELLNTGSLDGVYEGWCTNYQAPAPWGDLLPVELHWSDAPVPAGIVAQPDNLDLVNYLFNAYAVGDAVQVGAYPDGSPVLATVAALDLQDAVWALIDDADGWWDPLWATPATLALVDEAQAAGEGFVPGCGDAVVVLAVPLENLDGSSGNDVQTVAVEVPFAAAECL